MNVLLAFALAASVTTPTHLPPTAPCPEKAPAGTTCYEGRDANGAYYTIAVPKKWNKTLVVHSHGGPDLGDPTPERTRDDLNRWAVMVKEGYAWAGTSYRRGGYGTRMAAEDTDNLRRMVSGMLKPRKVFIHGQSWGGNVAAKTIELYRGYDAALLTSGVMAGGTRGVRLPRRPARGLPVLLRQPPTPVRDAVPAVAGPAPRLHDDDRRVARPHR